MISKYLAVADADSRSRIQSANSEDGAVCKVHM